MCTASYYSVVSIQSQNFVLSGTLHYSTVPLLWFASIIISHFIYIYVNTGVYCTIVRFLWATWFCELTAEKPATHLGYPSPTRLSLFPWKPFKVSKWTVNHMLAHNLQSNHEKKRESCDDRFDQKTSECGSTNKCVPQIAWMDLSALWVDYFLLVQHPQNLQLWREK